MLQFLAFCHKICLQNQWQLNIGIEKKKFFFINFLNQFCFYLTRSAYRISGNQIILSLRNWGKKNLSNLTQVNKRKSYVETTGRPQRHAAARGCKEGRQAGGGGEAGVDRPRRRAVHAPRRQEDADEPNPRPQRPHAVKRRFHARSETGTGVLDVIVLWY